MNALQWRRLQPAAKSPNEQRVDHLSTEEIEAMRGRIAAAGQG
jgi:hypothetical protein